MRVLVQFREDGYLRVFRRIPSSGVPIESPECTSWSKQLFAEYEWPRCISANRAKKMQVPSAAEIAEHLAKPAWPKKIGTPLTRQSDDGGELNQTSGLL